MIVVCLAVAELELDLGFHNGGALVVSKYL